MRPSLKQTAVEICEARINHKGEGGGLSFYALFANKNDDPELLMEAATWWIKTHRLDHFEKSIKDSTLASGRGVKIHPHKIVKSLPALSQDMGIGCIIGVEASEEPAILRRLGGVLVQGYSHSPPASETVRLLPIEGSARRTA